MDAFPLHRAAKKGLLENVRRLIELGVSVDSRDDRGRTPLHWATERRRDEVLQLLISSKCDLNIQDHYGRTPVLLAAFRHLTYAVRFLLQCGAQVSCADKDGFTLLHYVSEYGFTEEAHLIVHREEVDLNAVTKWGTTPLMAAAIWGKKDIVALLIRTGADVHRRDVWKRTVLHAVVSPAQVVQMLLEVEGLNLNPQDIDGETPLHKACGFGLKDVVEQLLVAGVDTTLKNKKGETALSDSLRRERPILNRNIISLYVQHGAFLEDCEYVLISQDPVLKESVLKDVSLCTQSIVNKFHRQSLPALSSISYFARKLPNIDKFQLNARQIDEVENMVTYEIKRNLFCNVAKAHPTALSARCVLSLITCQSDIKQFAFSNFGDNNSPFKCLRT